MFTSKWRVKLHHLGSPKNARQGDRRRVFFGVEEEFYES